MANSKTPTERIDAMSAWAFGDGGITEQLAALTARILPTADECDALSVELGALYDKYAPVRDTARETRNSLGEINDELRDIKAKLPPVEAQARLDAFGLNEVTKKPFTVKQTDDRAIVALAANEDYKLLTSRKRQLEGQKAGAQAVLADCESAFKEYGYRKDALRSQLDNFTARMGK